MRLDAAGDLILATPAGELKQHRPVAYQEIGGRRHSVAVRYRLSGRMVSFVLGEYDRSRALTVDPALSFAVSLNTGSVSSMAFDAAGNSCLTGTILTAAGFRVTPGAFQDRNRSVFPGFIAKLDSSGRIVYCTYIGGSAVEEPRGIAVDAAGNAHVVGDTNSADFPTTPGSIESSAVVPTGVCCMHSGFAHGAGT